MLFNTLFTSWFPWTNIHSYWVVLVGNSNFRR